MLLHLAPCGKFRAANTCDTGVNKMEIRNTEIVSGICSVFLAKFSCKLEIFFKEENFY